jgi:glutaminyl-tRNA synthetase
MDGRESPERGDGRVHKDFIRDIVTRDVAAGKHGGRVATRFPPEPNGYLHIGHAKSIVLNFGVAREFDGTCNLRFDDTNPATEDSEFVESIQQSVRWLGYEWDDLLYASDYFERFYRLAEGLIRGGKAYVDDSTEEEIRELRGTVTEPGRPSPYRDRPVEENLDLFRRMRAGEFPDGAKVLRAKIDLASPNMKMRDPLLYRIRHESHYRAGDAWCIYPMYDYAHCLEDAFEGITHSLCTLEFDNNREIYDWVIEHADVPHTPQQIEFARLNLSYTVMSKRKLRRLVREGHVEGWDDPRMPTLAGLARRGYTPEAIRAFCESIGVAKSNSVVDMAQLEHAIRDDLNTRAQRVLCVLDPLKVVIENYPAGEDETLDAPFWPRDVPREGSRGLPFSRELWIERSDFMEDPPKRFHRLAPGREVRLRYGYFIRCENVVKDDDGEVIELRCTYDPKTRGGSAPDGRSPKGTIHWVSARHAAPVEVRLYDRLFRVEQPDSASDLVDHLNPDSVEVIHPAYLEPAVAGAEPGSRFQFERQGYFYLDPENTAASGRPVYHRVVSLKDSWARKGQPEPARETPAPEKPTRPSKSAEGAATGPAEATAGRRSLAEEERFQRLHRELGVPEALADSLARREALTEVFEQALATYGGGAETLAHWVGNELARAAKERPLDELPVTPEDLGDLARLVDGGTLSASAAKTVFEEMVGGGGRPQEIVGRLGLTQLDDTAALGAAVERVIDAHPEETAQYREGKQALFGFFMGRLMAETGGRANPRVAQDLLRRRLDET